MSNVMDIEWFSGQLAQLVRAIGSHPRGRRFESFTDHCPLGQMSIELEVKREIQSTNSHSCLAWDAIVPTQLLAQQCP